MPERYAVRLHWRLARWVGMRRCSSRSSSLKKEETKREAVVVQLQDALAEVNALSGLLPICASCKKIRDDEGNWGHVESYIASHSEARFSHGICPECAMRLYPEIMKKKFNETINKE